MAELAAYTNAPLFSVKPTAVAVTRGLRYTYDTSGTVAASAIGVRGDFIASADAAASEWFSAFGMEPGGIVPLVASEAVTLGAPVYSAAVGKASITSGGGAILLGKAVSTASGDGILFECLLQNPA